MKSKFSKILIVILTLTCIGFAVTLVIIKFKGMGEKTDREVLNEKIIEEIKFSDSNIVDAMNKLNNISIVRYKVYTKSINTSSSNNVSNGANSSDSNSNSQNGDSQNSNSNGNDTNGNTGENNNSNNSTNQSVKISQSLAVNSLEETSDNNINWDTITSIYENLYSTWPTFSLDLQKAGISSENIEKYNISLNGIAQSINAKNKNSCLINFYNLYSQIPVYVENIINDSYKINLYNTKLSVLNAYTLATGEKWEDMNSSILASKNSFSAILNSVDDDDERKDNLEKVNIMIDNLQKSVNLNDKKIFYMHYKDVMQELETL